jgi:uncharacterized membrane protein YtjA (UPF0391 family)
LSANAAQPPYRSGRPQLGTLYAKHPPTGFFDKPHPQLLGRKSMKRPLALTGRRKCRCGEQSGRDSHRHRARRIEADGNISNHRYQEELEFCDLPNLLRSPSMLQLSVFFLVIALIAGVLGLANTQIIASEIAWVLFVVFLVLFLVSFVFGRRSPPV